MLDSRNPTPGEATGIVRLAAGQFHTVALRIDGRVLTWGSNTRQQLGHAVPSGTCNPGVGAFDRPAARLVDGLSGIVAVAAGESHSLAVRTDGTLWSWGYNLTGQLGNGSTTSTGTPVSVVGLTNVTTTVAASKAHSLAVTSDGAVWAWGANGGALGDGTAVSSSVPVRVMGMSDPVAVAAGDGTSYAVLDDGSLWAWGPSTPV